MNSYDRSAVSPGGGGRANWVTGASDLGLPPGTWPEELTFDGLGTFQRKEPDWANEDLAGWYYEDKWGSEGALLVIND
jgi:hypothetical protein